MGHFEPIRITDSLRFARQDLEGADTTASEQDLDAAGRLQIMAA